MKQSIIIGADTSTPIEVKRLGYGTMRLTGPDIWGEPKDRQGAIALLRRAVELGVNFFDTADFYGPGVTNRLLAEALSPYKSEVIIATKVGAKRGSDKSWQPYGQPEELRKSIENNLKELKLEQLQLVHFGQSAHSQEDYENSLGVMADMQKEGKIQHIGLSNASVEQFNKARKICDIASVENLYGYSQRLTDPDNPFKMQGGEVLPLCEELKIPFIPFFSLETALPAEQNKLKQLATEKGVSVAQVNIAWLLHKSDIILPIPGTTSIAHLEENIKAANIKISAAEMDFLG